MFVGYHIKCRRSQCYEMADASKTNESTVRRRKRVNSLQGKKRKPSENNQSHQFSNRKNQKQASNAKKKGLKNNCTTKEPSGKIEYTVF